MDQFGMAFMSSIGIVILLFKGLGLKRIIQYDLYIDISVTLGFLWFSGGTYSGISMAIMTGLIVSIILWILKITF